MRLPIRHQYALVMSTDMLRRLTNRRFIIIIIINSKRGPILPRFRDIQGFRRRATPPLFRPNFKNVPFGLHCRCCESYERRP